MPATSPKGCFEVSFCCAERVASGLVVKTPFGPFLAPKSLTIRLLDPKNRVPPSRGSERLTGVEDRSHDRQAKPSWTCRQRYPLAEQPANRYSASGPGGLSSTTPVSWPH